jgi:hypothetical protein
VAARALVGGGGGRALVSRRAEAEAGVLKAQAAAAASDGRRSKIEKPFCIQNPLASGLTKTVKITWFLYKI